MEFGTVLTLVVLFLCSLLFLRKKLHEQQWKFPPGPSGLPFIGSVFPLVSSIAPHIIYSEWAMKYGGIYTVTILTKKVLIVSCPKLMRQIFDHPATAAKADFLPILLLADGRHGITATEGRTWMEQRKFCVRTLRQFGMGKRNEIQEKILSEADRTVMWIKEKIVSNNGVVDSPINLLKLVTSKTLWNIVRGDRTPLDEDLVRKLTTDFSDAINASGKRGLDIFPWLKWVAPEWSGYSGLVRSCNNLRDFIHGQFKEHQDHRHENDEPRDMIDVYLDQMEKTTKDNTTNSTFYGETGWKNSIAVIAEMFVGGGDSTPHTLNWLLLHLIHHPDIQKKLHEEIDQVLGTQQPTLMDKSRMPYTEAVILEGFRKCPAFPVTFSHKLSTNVDNLCGFKLPRGTHLISNMYHAHKDKNIWGDPEVFRPKRFLFGESITEEMVAERKASVVPFNVGKRACLAESLSMDVIFLFLVKLFQAFRISPFPEESRPDFESSEPFLLVAKPYSIVVRERNH